MITVHHSRQGFKRSILIVLLNCMAFFSSAEEYTFSGTIGEFPIYMNIRFNDGYIEGNYFYKNQLMDIPLEGKLNGKKLTLTSIYFPLDSKYDERFELNWNVDQPEGVWIKGVKKMAVKLSKPTSTEINNIKVSSNPFLKEHNDYSKIKVGFFKLKSMDSVSYTNGYKLRYFEELHTKQQFFRIDSGMVGNTLTTVNHFLENQHLSDFLGYLSTGSNPDFHEYYCGYSDLHISETWITMAVSSSVYYGGAHSVVGNYGLNFHIPTSSILSLTDVIKADYQNNDDIEIDPIREAAMVYLKREYPDLMKKAETDEFECDFGNPNNWISYNTLFTKEGVQFMLYYPHILQDCSFQDWMVVPYLELKPFIKPEFYPELETFGK